MSGDYNSPAVLRLYHLKASGTPNPELKKQLWAERASFSPRVNDVFSTGRFRSTLRYSNVSHTWNNQW